MSADIKRSQGEVQRLRLLSQRTKVPEPQETEARETRSLKTFFIWGESAVGKNAEGFHVNPGIWQVVSQPSLVPAGKDIFVGKLKIGSSINWDKDGLKGSILAKTVLPILRYKKVT